MRTGERCCTTGNTGGPTLAARPLPSRAMRRHLVIVLPHQGVVVAPTSSPRQPPRSLSTACCAWPQRPGLSPAGRGRLARAWCKVGLAICCCLPQWPERQARGCRATAAQVWSAGADQCVGCWVATHVRLLRCCCNRAQGVLGEQRRHWQANGDTPRKVLMMAHRRPTAAAVLQHKAVMMKRPTGRWTGW